MDPTTYYAGMRLGAIGLADNTMLSMGILALEWAVALPAALWFGARIHDSAKTESIKGETQ